MDHSDIIRTLTISAPVDVVFAVLTKPEHIVRYFPFDRVEAEWQAGGQIRFDGKINGEPFSDIGTIIEFNHPHRFAYRYWSTNHGTEQSPENELIVSYELRKIWNETELFVKHERFPTPAMFHLMSEAWDAILPSLKAYTEQQVK